MKIDFTLEAKDFLAYQLYTASKSKRIKRSMLRTYLIWLVGCILFGIYFYWKENNALAIYFGIISLASALFFFKYLKWRYKRHYRNHIKENYKNKINQLVKIEFKDGFIYSQDKTGEAKIDLSQLLEINEITEYFFLKMSTGDSLILPKRVVENQEKLKEKFQNLGLKINEELNWKW